MTRTPRTIMMCLAATALTAASAHAVCSPPTATVFAGYRDANLYAAVPGADFETQAAGWDLTRAEAVADQADGLGLAADAFALQIEPGGSAVSPPFCVTRDFQGVRLFSRTPGTSKGAGLQVELVVKGKGTSASVVKPSTDWTLSPSLSLANRTAGMAPGAEMDVQLRVRNLGKTSAQVDDVYVDPRLKR